MRWGEARHTGREELHSAWPCGAGWGETPLTSPQTPRQSDGCNQHPEPRIWRVPTEHLRSDQWETVSGRKGHWTESKPTFRHFSTPGMVLGLFKVMQDFLQHH